MLFVSVLRTALLILVPLSIALTSYLYLYPVFHLCTFPSPNRDATSSYLNTFRQHISFLHHESPSIAPFRLLALGDPQLEGDTSLNRNAKSLPNLSNFWKDALLLEGRKHSLLQRIRLSLHDLVDFYFEDIPNILEYSRKRIDLRGNDYYLAHIYRTLHWWTNPTHVSVLGDLVGSQWISDEEFAIRGHRYWNRVFKHGKRVEDELAFQPNEDEFEKSQPLVLGEDEEWKRRIINIAGNHDIGYAGDLTPERLSRFERVFGKANYELRFRLPEKNLSIRLDPENSVTEDWAVEEKARPELRIVVLNDMNLDGPVLSQPLQEQSYKFLNDIITTSRPVTQPAHFTLILTHIPLYKPSGICIDGPLFEYHHDTSIGSGIREQNHLSQDASKGFLEGLLGMSADPSVDGGGMGRKGLIINGHDHEGCDAWHFTNQTSFETGRSSVSSEDSVAIPVEDVKLETDLGTETETELDLDVCLNINTLVSLSLSPNSDLPAPPSQGDQPAPEPPLPTWRVLRNTHTLSSLPSSHTSHPLPGTREITLRSMMGDFGGSAGLLSLWFDEETWEWKYEFQSCGMGTQHIWWVVHIVDLMTVGVGVVYLGVVGLRVLEREVGVGGKVVRGQKEVNGKVKNADVVVGNGMGRMGYGNANGNGNGKRSHALRKKKSRPSLRDAGLNGL